MNLAPRTEPPPYGGGLGPDLKGVGLVLAKVTRCLYELLSKKNTLWSVVFFQNVRKVVYCSQKSDVKAEMVRRLAWKPRFSIRKILVHSDPPIELPLVKDNRKSLLNCILQNDQNPYFSWLSLTNGSSMGGSEWTKKILIENLGFHTSLLTISAFTSDFWER